MRIQHNIPAMNAYRNYTLNNSALAKNLEKLSAGYRINRAGDDAAGLAISEKMRAQITGLEVAQKNAKDGISLVQTAEGALTEVHDMLNRMVTLAEQSANGTYADDVDREQLQKEIDQLRTEINRIADSSNFNGINLLDGTLGMNTKAFSSAITTSSIELGNAVVASAVKSDSWATWSTAVAATATIGDVGSVTFLKEQTASAQFGEFTIDLQNLKAVAASNATHVKVSLTLTNNVGAGSVSIVVSTADGVHTVKTADIASKIVSGVTASGADVFRYLVAKASGSLAFVSGSTVSAAKAAAASAAKGGGLIYEASVVGSNNNQVHFKLVGYNTTSSVTASAFTAIGTGAASEELKEISIASAALGAFNNLTVTIASATGIAATNGLTGEYNPGALNIKNTVVEGAAQLANTNVSLDMYKIKDGYEITVGGDTYVFKIGSDSKVTATENVIDLSDYDDLSSSSVKTVSDALTVMGRITQAMENNTIFTVGHGVSSTAATATAALTTALASAINYGMLTLAERPGLDYTASNGAISSASMATIKKALMNWGTSVDDPEGIRSLVQVRNGEHDLRTGVEFNLKSVGHLNDGDQLNLTIGTGTAAKEFSFTFSKGTAALNVSKDGKVTYTGTETASAILNKLASTINKKVGATVAMVDDSKLQILDSKGDVKLLGRGLTLQIGDTSDSFNQLNVALQDMHTTSLGIADIDISTQAGAAAALDKIRSAINTVSDVRGTLGATQNRLDHTINNLSVMRENIQDAESTIRDTDVAEEMMAFTKNSILNQAAQAMLAQANQLPQGVLQLLQ